MKVIMLEEKGRVPIAADRDKILDRFLKEEKLTDAKLFAGENVKSLLAIGKLFEAPNADDYRVLFIKTSADRIFVLGAEQQAEFDKRIKAALETSKDEDASAVVQDILFG